MPIDLEKAQKFFCRFPFSMLLAGSSVLYGLGVTTRKIAYKFGLVRQNRLPGFVLSVGNITVGGTGKTPVSIMVAEWAKKEGYSVCVLSRGYGGDYAGTVLEVSDGREVKVSWKQCGDEPYLMANILDGVPVVVAKSRYLGGMYAVEKFGANFFVLDDGFQHWKLERDFDLVLLNSSQPFGNGHLLPWGILREPISAIKRAHALIVVKARRESEAGWLKNGEFTGMPIFMGSHVAESVIFQNGRDIRDPLTLAGKKIVAFAGIGRPSAFEETLRDLDAKVIAFEPFPDHHIYRREEIVRLEQMTRDLGADYLLTTEKDWVKVSHLVNDIRQIGFLRIRFKITNLHEEFFGIIRDAISKKLAICKDDGKVL